jgi:hypothetical protein
MRSVLRSPRSPAVVISILALVAGLTGAAVAGPLASTSKLTKKEKKQVRNIADSEINKLAPGIADSEINKLAPGLTVASAQPVTFAQINSDGTVVGSNSKGFTQSNVSHPATGYYCISGIAGGIRGLQAVVDYDASDADETTQVGLGQDDATAICPGSSQAFVAVFTGEGIGTPEDNGFFVHLYH